MENKSTTEQLQEVLAEAAKQFSHNEANQRLVRLIERLESEGKLIKGEYSIPPIDTIGRRMYADLRSSE